MTTILVIDDDYSVYGLLREVLHNNFQLLYADCAQSAMALLGKEKIDLVILDLMMPQRSGFSLLEEIKAKFHIPVLILTNIKYERAGKNVLKSGADVFVNKSEILDIQPYITRLLA